MAEKIYRAVDSFYTDNTKTVHAREQFTAKSKDLSDIQVDELVRRGLITEVAAAEPVADKKAEGGAPQNKAETAAPKNK